MHAARLCFYLDSLLNVAADTKDIFRHLWYEGQRDLASIVNVPQFEDDAVVVLEWVGLGPDE